MSVLWIVLSVLLLVPYFGWGLLTLRIRYTHHEEISPKVEAATLVAVGVALSAVLYSLRLYMAQSWLLYLFTALGLMVSFAALYGPMLVSLMAHFLVDLILPRHPETAFGPQFGPAEALERIGDYEGAIKEYMVMARIYPNDSTTLLRIGDNLARLEEHGEAAKWFERAMRHLSDPEKYLHVINRVAEIYQRRLHMHEDAIRVLRMFEQKFPESGRAESVRARIARLEEDDPPAGSSVSVGPAIESMALPSEDQ